MRTLLLFLARLLAISLVLYAVHRYIMLGYEVLLLLVCQPFAPSAESATAYYDSSYRIIPLLALILATPELTWKRRLAVLGIGVGVFWGMDLISTLIFGAPPPKTMNLATRASQVHIVYSLTWELLGHWVLPFVLWIVPLHREILTLLPAGEKPSNQQA